MHLALFLYFRRHCILPFQKQDRVTAGANRTPTPKTRRATGESVYRDRKPGHNRPAGGTSISKITSAPSAPRPIPKQNKSGNTNGKSLQPPSSYSYSFDDNAVDPFMPSTPPTFIASMEPTFFKSDITANKNKSKEDPGPSKCVDEAPVTKPPNSTARRPRPRSSTISTPSTTSYPTTSSPRAPDSPKSPVPTSAKSGISQMREARMRDASISSILKPSHDDMILPAVARRIKEEGLFNHDVIAYSDDYNAPLYRLPTTSGGVGNPFASYDREKAASSSNLLTSKGPSSDNDQYDGSKNEKPTVNSRYEEDPIKKTHKKQSSSVSPVQRETSPTPLERRQTPSSSPVPEAIPQVLTPSSNEPREDKKSDIILTTAQEPSIPSGSRPDRPRRARRNTEGRQRMDLQEQEQYARQQSPTPDRKGQVSENDIQALVRDCCFLTSLKWIHPQRTILTSFFYGPFMFFRMFAAPCKEMIDQTASSTGEARRWTKLRGTMSLTTSTPISRRSRPSLWCQRSLPRINSTKATITKGARTNIPTTKSATAMNNNMTSNTQTIITRVASTATRNPAHIVHQRSNTIVRNNKLKIHTMVVRRANNSISNNITRSPNMLKSLNTLKNPNMLRNNSTLGSTARSSNFTLSLRTSSTRTTPRAQGATTVSTSKLMATKTTGISLRVSMMTLGMFKIKHT